MKRPDTIVIDGRALAGDSFASCARHSSTPGGQRSRFSRRCSIWLMTPAPRPSAPQPGAMLSRRSYRSWPIWPSNILLQRGTQRAAFAHSGCRSFRRFPVIASAIFCVLAARIGAGPHSQPCLPNLAHRPQLALCACRWKTARRAQPALPNKTETLILASSLSESPEGTR